MGICKMCNGTGKFPPPPPGKPSFSFDSGNKFKLPKIEDKSKGDSNKYDNQKNCPACGGSGKGPDDPPSSSPPMSMPLRMEAPERKRVRENENTNFTSSSYTFQSELAEKNSHFSSGFSPGKNSSFSAKTSSSIFKGNDEPDPLPVSQGGCGPKPMPPSPIKIKF